MKTAVKCAIITGIFGIVSTTIGAIGVYLGKNAENTRIEKEIAQSGFTDINEGDSAIEAICDFFDKYETMIKDYDEMNSKYEALKKEKENLISQNNNYIKQVQDLQTENEYLRNEINILKPIEDQQKSLLDENLELKSQISELENKLEKLENSGSMSTEQSGQANNNMQYPTNTSSKVSVFTLDTFQRKGGWYGHTSSILTKQDFTDTYGNEYLSGYVTNHCASEKDDGFSPIYLLNGDYTVCEGKMAWTKRYKDYEGSVWLDFYSGDDLIYSTQPITAVDEPLSFQFSIEGLDTITIVKNSSSRQSVHIVYEYLDFVK